MGKRLCARNGALRAPIGSSGHARPPPLGRVTGGFLYKLGGGSYTIRILMYPACILHVSCMYSSRYIKIHQDTSRYNKIHLYLSLWP